MLVISMAQLPNALVTLMSSAWRKPGSKMKHECPGREGGRVFYRPTVWMQKSATCLVGALEKVYQLLDATAPVDVGLVGRDLGKLPQSSHHINQHIHRLFVQQAHQGIQSSVLLEPSDKMEELNHDVPKYQNRKLLSKIHISCCGCSGIWTSGSKASGVLSHVAEVSGALPDDPSGGDQELLVVGLLQQGDQRLEAVALRHDVTGLLVSCTLQSHTAGGRPDGLVSGSQSGASFLESAFHRL